MTLANLFRSMDIFRKYISTPNGRPFSAEHDEFYVSLDHAVTDDDAKTLEELGWFRSYFEKHNMSWMTYV